MAGEGEGSSAGSGPLNEDSDETLAARVQTGDREALEGLVRRYLRPVHAAVASFLPDTVEVEDAAQETFLRALRAFDRYDPTRPFAPWLYQIARNVARNRLADQGRWRMEPELPEGREPAEGGPDASAERAEIRDRVERALTQLPEQRRTAFRLVDVEGMAPAEAARFMGLSPGTIRSHVHHARRQLRELLSEFLEGSPKSSNESGGHADD